MIRHTLIALTLPLAMSAAAFADDGASKSGSTGSEMEHQADAGKWEVTPGFTLGSFKTTYNAAFSNGQTSTTDSSSTLFVKGEYGINEMFAAGVMLGYGTDSFSYSPAQTNVTTKNDGMLDPVLYFLGHNDVGPGSIHYGLNWDLSVSKHQMNITTENQASGGMSFTPFVGYEMAVGPGTLGAKLSDTLIQTTQNVTDNTQVPSQSATIKPGSTFMAMAFWEMNFQPVIWGADISLTSRSGDSFTEAGVNQPVHDSVSVFGIATYANWECTPDIHILPTLGLGATNQALGTLGVGASGISGLYGTVAARFAF